MTQLNKTQKLLMWDLLFETFPAPGGHWKRRQCWVPWHVPESSSSERCWSQSPCCSSLSQGLYSPSTAEGSTQPHLTPDTRVHTQAMEREKERKRGQDQRERLPGNAAAPRAPAVFQVPGRKSARMKQHLSNNTTVQQTEHITHMLPFL